MSAKGALVMKDRLMAEHKLPAGRLIRPGVQVAIERGKLLLETSSA